MKVEDTKAKIVPCITMYEHDPMYPIFLELIKRLDKRDKDTDDETPPYHQMQAISGQISRAQGGQGPFRARLLDIATIALATILSIDRSQS